MSHWMRKHGLKLLPMGGAVIELMITGGSLEASNGRLAVYYLTTMPWGSLATVIVGGVSSIVGVEFPSVLYPLIIALTGAIQGAVLAAVVYGVLFLRRRGSGRAAERP